MSEPAFHRNGVSFLASIWFAFFGAVASFFLGNVVLLDRFDLFERMGLCALLFAFVGAILGYVYPKFTKAVLFDIFLGGGGRGGNGT